MRMGARVGAASARKTILESDSLGLNRHSSESWNLFAFHRGLKRKAGFQLSLE
jgi:hypothetical protein